jgi:hypothetical protein
MTIVLMVFLMLVIDTVLLAIGDTEENGKQVLTLSDLLVSAAVLIPLVVLPATLGSRKLFERAREIKRKAAQQSG